MQVKQKNAAVIALGVLMVGVIWYQFVYSSSESAASKASQEAQDQQTSIDQLKSQVQKASGEVKTPEQQKASLEDLQNAIPVQSKMTEFLRELDSIRTETGVAFQAITPSTPTPGNGVANINLGITVQGSYEQVMGYVDKLMQVPRLVLVDNVNVTAGSSGTGAPAGGGPTGDVFAGQGSAPVVQVQLTARLFSIAPDGYAATTTQSGKPVSSSSSSSSSSSGSSSGN